MGRQPERTDVNKNDLIQFGLVLGCSWLIVMLAFGLAQLAALR
jgi:hypothetical protein